MTRPEKAAFFRVEGTLVQRGAFQLAAYLAANGQGFAERLIRLGQVALASPAAIAWPSPLEPQGWVRGFAPHEVPEGRRVAAAQHLKDPSRNSATMSGCPVWKLPGPSLEGHTMPERSIPEDELEELRKEAIEHLWVHTAASQDMEAPGGIRVVTSAQGSQVTDAEGNTFYDPMGGLELVNKAYHEKANTHILAHVDGGAGP